MSTNRKNMTLGLFLFRQDPEFAFFSTNFISEVPPRTNLGIIE